MLIDIITNNSKMISVERPPNAKYFSSRCDLKNIQILKTNVEKICI